MIDLVSTHGAARGLGVAEEQVREQVRRHLDEETPR